MTLEHYNKLLAQPQNCSTEDLSGLNIVVDQFPFFQSAQALRLKVLKQQEALGYNQALKKTAAITTDRDVLFDYITSAEFAQQTLSESLLGHQDHVKQIEVTLDLTQETEAKTQEHAQKETAEDLKEQPSVQRLSTPDQEVATELKSIAALDEKPFEFDHSERHSFEQWLKLTSAKPIDRNLTAGDKKTDISDPVNSKDSKSNGSNPEGSNQIIGTQSSEDKWEKIDRFLAQKTSIKPQDSDNGQNKAEAYLQSHDELMTETLARVYAQQKNYQKAIQAYKILILKYPEKSGFFADQIQELKRLLNA